MRAVAARSGAISRAARERILEAGRVGIDIGEIERELVRQMNQQSAEQAGIHAGRDRQEQVRLLGGDRAARIDHHELGAAFALVGDHALEQDRMTPRGIRSDQDDDIGLVEIGVAAWNGIGPERTPMAGDR